ncbi:alpha/beta hydrolase family protein [Rhizobium sp. C4]|uniref:alpha/beta hydrolase family protein n=1 Tax=Rhizobium sp. C4 TaxID=1349800 RepID=UPI001E4E0932|nr:alpha/beta fold hydrolase [Rhizobium sp. C4]MCD2171683.1 alpha/beta fold hydrolase [Rhizobium sp. C4]
MSMSYQIHRTDIRIDAEDGFPLAGTLTTGPGDGPAALISSATAVPRGFYRSFAETLVTEHGFSATLTYDYRGTGGSRDARFDGRRISMRDWAHKDLPAALDALKAVVPSKAIVGVGQSYGGQALGLSGRHAAFQRYLMIVPMSGYWRGTAEPWKVLTSMNLIGVPLAVLTGRVPQWAGIGIELPGGVFRDWARWCRDKDYFFNDPVLKAREAYAAVTTPILAIGVKDDPWGTPTAMDGLIKYYSNAPVERRWADPIEAGGAIGHIGFFKSRFKETLWPQAIDWLKG